ncbi:hypothetical protein JTB14_030479 [Gonioctena quinquepunctata]|nr:hypothetical protein JTB14_030479 [Gonioctena quinquepunctata]
MYWDSIQADTYKPNINIDEYGIELVEADTILRKKDPKTWRKFIKMGQEYCDEHTRYKVDKSTKENLIDYCTENNDEDIAKKEEKKGMWLRLAEEDRKLQREQLAREEKRDREWEDKQRERKLQRELQKKLARERESMLDEKLINEGETNKQAPSVEEPPPKGKKQRRSYSDAR